MAFFRKKKTLNRCRGLRRYVQGLDDMRVQDMYNFLMQNKKNRVTVNHQYLSYVNAAGAVVLAVPIALAATDFDTIELSSTFARIGRQVTDWSTGGVDTSGVSVDDNGIHWDSFGNASDDGTWTNNNNNNNNNNG